MTNGLSPVDYTSDIGVVRLLIPDTALDADENYLFSDDQLEALLSVFNGSTRRAAAQGKDVLATDQLLLLKVVRTDDLSVDGAKVAAELRLQAKQLRDLADADDAAAGFDYFKIVYPGTGYVYPEGVPLPYGLSVTGVTPAPWPSD